MSYIYNTLSSWWTSILQSLGLYNKKGSILLLGLDNAGKTTLLHRLSHATPTTTTTSNTNDDHSSSGGAIRAFPPTDRPRQDTFTYQNITFSAWDLGGHEAVRHLWQDYVGSDMVSAICFLIDSSDTQRLEEAGYELDALLGEGLIDVRQVPIALLFNKCDMEQAASNETICQAIDFEHLLQCQCQPHLHKQPSPPLQGTTGDEQQVVVEEDPSLAHIDPRDRIKYFRISVLQGTGYPEAFRWIASFL